MTVCDRREAIRKTALAAESCVGKIYAPSIGGRDDPE
jgi:hypothetical protein